VRQSQSVINSETDYAVSRNTECRQCEARKHRDQNL
jgi:hypothetical protein